MSEETKVRVLREDAKCNACDRQIQRELGRGRAPNDVAVSPHAASFLLVRHTAAGLLLSSTACARAVAEELLVFEAAANDLREAV